MIHGISNLLPNNLNWFYRDDSNHTKDFNRWKQWGFKPEIFQNHYEFAKFLLESPLGNQMKIFTDPIIMVDEQPGIIVEGEWASFEEIKDRFEVHYSSEHGQKFMRDKQSHEIYTFLGNGQGLQKHNPYTEEKLTPLLKLNLEEYERTLEMAGKFVREGELDETREEKNKDRTFILQIVSSYIDGANTNASELLTRRQHTWIRLIAGEDDSDLGIMKGDVFEMGYEWDSPYKLPALTTQGRFRSEDLWNYIRPKERVVTNIAVTQEEMYKIVDYMQSYQREATENGQKIAFNYFRQNCSAFVHHAVKQAGIHVPTKIVLTALIEEISPDWMKAIGSFFSQAGSKIKEGIKSSVNWLPNPLLEVGNKGVNAAYKVAYTTCDTLGVAGTSLFSFILGGAMGQKALAFSKHPQDRKELIPTLLRPKNFFSMKKFYYHLPGKFQEWQRLQPSTAIYRYNDDDPNKIAVVPLI